MQITDLHYGESEEKDSKTTSLVEKMLLLEKPDLVVLTGDMVSGFAWDKSAGWYQNNWKKWTAPFQKYEVPYLYSLGNHDAEADLTREEIIELDIQHPFSLTQKGLSHLEGNNFRIPI